MDSNRRQPLITGQKVPHAFDKRQVKTMWPGRPISPRRTSPAVYSAHLIDLSAANHPNVTRITNPRVHTFVTLPSEPGAAADGA